MDKIRACVGDVVAIASSVAWHDLSEAKRRLELLFADAERQAEAPRKEFANSSVKRSTRAKAPPPNISWMC
jgi:hypothetical protein